MLRNVKVLAGWAIAASIFPATVWSQKVETAKPWETGDRLTFNWVLNGKPVQLVEEVVNSADGRVGLRYQASGRTYDGQLGEGGLTYPKGICLANGQACDFSPAYEWIKLPLEKGTKWSGTMTVTGETFVAIVEYERVVEKVEKIKTAVGTFDAYRVASSGRIKATDKAGANPSKGKESGTDWLAVVNGKFVPVKNEYKNSYGEKFNRELTALEMK